MATPVLAASYIDASRIGMDDLQRLPIQLFPAWLFGFVGCLLPVHDSPVQSRLDFGSARFRSV